MKWHEILGIVGAVASILGFGAIALVQRIFRHKRNRFAWCPIEPITNNNVNHINEHPVDFLFDIRSGKVTGNPSDLTTMATGKVTLNQHLINFVITERGRYVIFGNGYGTEEAETIFTEKNAAEFCRQAENLGISVMSYYSDWIEKLYSISRVKDTLIIEYKVKGIPETLECEIPRISN